MYLFFAETSKKELARFAKNFLPIFFNLYTSDPEKERDPIRMALLETIRIYVKIADQQVMFLIIMDDILYHFL